MSPQSLDRQNKIQSLYARLGALAAAELRAAALSDYVARAQFEQDIEYACLQIAELTALECRAAAWEQSLLDRVGGRYAA